MPDVVALPLHEAEKLLSASGWDYQVVRISSAYRQQELADHKILLSTIMKRRKEVLEYGLQN